MNKKMKIFSLFLLITLFVFSGCTKNEKKEVKKNPVKAKTEQQQPKKEDVIKIGAVFSASGPASFLGAPEKNTAEFYIDKLNAQGGINGKKIKLIVYDTEGSEKKTVMATNRLIQKDNVIAIIGPSRSGSTLAIIPIIEKAKIPLISCAASKKIVTPVTERRYVFNTPQLDVYAVARVYQYFNKKGYKKVALLTVNNGFGASGREELLGQAEKAGLKIVADEIFGPKDTDMTPQLTKIKSLKPDAIVVWGTNPGPAVVARNRLQLGIKTPLFMSHGVASKKFIELAGNDAAEGIILPAGKLIVANQLPDDDPQKQLLLDYANSYKAKYGSNPSTFGGHAYDAVKILTKALKETNSTDADTIVNAVENIKELPGTGGIFSFSKEKHNGLSKDSFALVEIVNGDWKLVK